jgi:hypothetical protein
LSAGGTAGVKPPLVRGVTLRPFPLLTALVVLLVSGLVHGFWTQRWHTAAALDSAVSRLNTVPLHAGIWKAVNIDVDPEPYEQARAVGYWMRRYTNVATGDSLSVILMCGRAGHMAVHTPDICYRGAGYEMVGEPAKYRLPGSADCEFWRAAFRLPGQVGGAELEIYWAWGAEDSWKAPSSPRLVFGGQPYLYKLYVVREAAGNPLQDAVTAEFLRQLMPDLEAALFSPEKLTP